ncbi:phospholipid-transporting ATPase ABCA3-like [Physella acuta]|uniref:phospholipid-transporting ATPase ABCA3-like n=1 Tax=Physella acuta TaxID=109671 RepID=UPI0027DBBCB0|nr:phospholipid-transporting ATPase ABCA3-like [Physella acuta]
MYVCFNEHHRINHARYKRNYESDNDVTAVRMRIINDSLTILFANDEIIVYNICKKYRIRDRALVAVENTSLGLKKNDFFGLLGNTGCGKSTLLNMMVGKIMMTYGDVYYNGHSIKTDFFKVAKHIGYCSQDDYLINELTGRETLLLFGRIRGVPEQRLQRIVEYLADVTLLTSIVDFRVQNYNIINRRKLSFAIAIIGNPPYILMDEPTKGVEPIVKLAMWSLLRHHQKSGCTIILASESCRECTTLCTTMAVMVDSRIVCLGTPEQLSRKYGNSYTISLHLKDGLDTTKHIVKHIHTVFKRVPVYETDMYVHFELPQNLMPLSKLFTLTETMKVELDLDSYTIRHTSLELKYLFYMWKEEDH